MGKVMLLNETIILAWYCYFSIANRGIDTKSLVLSTLIYAVIRLSYYIVSNEKFRLVNIAISISFIMALAIFKHVAIIVLIPGLILLLNDRVDKVIIISVMGILPFVLPGVDRGQYFLIALLNYVTYENTYNTNRTLIKLNQSIESLRLSNLMAMNRLGKSEEYEKNLENMTKLIERNTIAQEIHDEVGHILAGSIMQLEASKLLIDVDTHRSKGLIDNTIDVLKDGMDRIRLTLRSIKPETYEMGINRIKTLIAGIRQSCDIAIFLDYGDDLSGLENKHWIAIESNVKEGITNAIKYSKASKITVRFTRLNKLYKVEIIDDGIGSTRVDKGLGIRGMEERTEAINGTLIVNGTKGFSVIMLLPISEGERLCQLEC